MNDFQLGNIHPGYLHCAQSGMPSRDKINYGRPYGGLGFVTKIETENSRICALKLMINGFNTLCVNIYLPCDKGSFSTEDNSYIDCLNYVQQLIELQEDTHGIVLGGDFNTDFDRKNIL